MIIGYLLGMALIFAAVVLFATGTSNPNTCFFGDHDWPDYWRSGTATRRRTGQILVAEGQECIRCGKVRFRTK